MSIQSIENLSPQNYCYDVKDQLKSHIYRRSDEAFAAGDTARDAITNIEQLKARQSTMRKKFIEALGGLPPMDTPLNARTVGTVDDDGFKIEKIIYQSRPGVYVTANLYIPDGITSPRGAVLFLCGHAEEAKHWSQYQEVCRYIVKTGLVVLAQDPVGQGERFSYYDSSTGKQTVSWGTCEHDHAGWQCYALGDSIARYFVHDGMRGVDLLISRPEVDPSKIGVTGNSGGGTQTSLIMVCDPRIAAAAPGTFIMNRQTYMYAGGAQDQEQIWPTMTAFGFDHEDILLMMAPKPVRVLSVTYDFFPIEGTRRTVKRCKRIWEACGAAGQLDLVEDVSVHNYTRPLAKAAAEFFSKHLLGKAVSPEDSEVNATEAGKLWCTQSGQVSGEINGAKFVYDENQDRLAEIEAKRNSLPEKERKDRAIFWLNDVVFHARKNFPLNPRIHFNSELDGLSVESAFWWAQDNIINHGICFRDLQFNDEHFPVTAALWENGSASLESHMDWIKKTCAEGRAVVVLNLSGMGSCEPNQIALRSALDFYGVMHKLFDDLVWLDDSICAMRIYDIIRSLDMFNAWPGLDGSDTRFHTGGRYNVYPLLASLLDKRVGKVESVDGLESYASWVRSRYYEHKDIASIILPGILKYMDLPDVAQWR